MIVPARSWIFTVMHQLLLYASELHPEIGFLPEKPLMHSGSLNSVQFSR